MSAPAILHLDFSPATKRPPLSGLLLLALGIVAVVLAAIDFQSAHAVRNHEAALLRDLQSRIAEIRKPSKPDVTDRREVQAAAAVMRDLRMPWPQLLAVFEGAASQSVALLGIDPAPSQQLVRLTAEAKTVESMLDYLDALRREPLSEVVLVGHQVSETTPGSPIRFQAQAKWKTN